MEHWKCKLQAINTVDYTLTLGPYLEEDGKWRWFRADMEAQGVEY